MAPRLNALDDTQMSNWQIMESFDSATACEQELTNVWNMAHDPKFQKERRTQAAKEGGAIDDKHWAEYVRRVEEEVCVATDDPRLKP